MAVKLKMQGGQAFNYPNTGNYTAIERYLTAALPASQDHRNKVVLVTDSTYVDPAGTGLAPIGGGSNLQLCWSDGFTWRGL
jgi:hypothetical protein